MTNITKMLTKSNYLLGLQCPKLLWVTKNDKDRIPEPDAAALENFKVGTLIGELATLNFENGIDLSKLGFKENIEKTKESLLERRPIFEAGILKNDLFSRADVLVPTGSDKWDIIEVKSATKVKPINIHDVAFQKYVYEKSGLKIRKCFLMHINSSYVKNGEINPAELFTKTCVTAEVEEASLGIEKRIEEMLEIINSKDEIKIKIGEQCNKPYDCPLIPECWSKVPQNSVFEFGNIRKKKAFELYDNGIKLLRDVPDNVKLNDKQKIQRLLALAPEGVSRNISEKMFTKGKVHIDKKQIDFFLGNLNYPIYYLDFETINSGVPKFDNSKPYEQIPFQYSLHIQDEPNGELKHKEFLAVGTTDPRINFLESLKDNLGEAGDILVYNQAFEKMVLRRGAQVMPEYEEWYNENILPRIKDLMDVFKNFWYYDPKQKGSFSIKAVLPVLSELKYDSLEIRKGDVASREFERVTYNEVEDEERERVREALLDYCRLDTLAEVEIIHALYDLINKK